MIESRLLYDLKGEKTTIVPITCGNFIARREK